jgi:hypothetical protein
MKNRKGQILLYFVLIILVMILVFLLYILWQYLPSESQTSEVFLPEVGFETGNLSYKVSQFYPNMKFNHNEISYNIEDACSEEKTGRMKEAFMLLQEQVGIISFYETDQEPDIRVMCSKEVESVTGRNFFVAGEGGAEQIIQTKKYNVITKGIVLLFDEPHNAISCSWPNVELHELMHVFGFEHSEDRKSLMYPYLESCEQKLDEEIINDLKTLYSQPNLPDLYFENVRAVKHGKYLDFNATIKNAGVVDAENIVLSVHDDDKEGDRFPLEDIGFGAGVTFSVSNSQLTSRYSEVVELRLDDKNRIEELDEENNIARLVFE